MTAPAARPAAKVKPEDDSAPAAADAAAAVPQPQQEGQGRRSRPARLCHARRFSSGDPPSSEVQARRAPHATRPALQAGRTRRRCASALFRLPRESRSPGGSAACSLVSGRPGPPQRSSLQAARAEHAGRRQLRMCSRARARAPTHTLTPSADGRIHDSDAGGRWPAIGDAPCTAVAQRPPASGPRGTAPESESLEPVEQPSSYPHSSI